MPVKKKSSRMDQGGDKINNLLKSLSKSELRKVAAGIAKIDREQLKKKKG